MGGSVEEEDEPQHDEEEGSSTVEEEEEEEGPVNAAATVDSNIQEDNQVTFSKSWAIDTAHVPIYTGGKISPLHLKNKDDDDEDMANAILSCMLLPFDGDLVIVDAQRGTKLGSVREMSGNRTYSNSQEDDDEDEGLDRDAITAYALSPDNTTLVTCSRNHLMQQYEIKLLDNNKSNENDPNNNSKPSISVKLLKTWGRSGHALPVSEMEFHLSGVFVATASIDGTCRIFDARAGHVTHIYRPIAAGVGAGASSGSGRHGVSCIAWMSDNTHLVIAIGRDDGSIAIHDLRDKDMKRVVVLREHMGAVTGMNWWWKQQQQTKNTNKKTATSASAVFYPTMFVAASRDAVVNLWQIRDSPQSASADNSNKGKNKKKKKPKKQTKDSSSLDGTPVYERISTHPVFEQVEGMVLLPNEGTNARSMKIATAGSNGVVRMWQYKSKTEDGDDSKPVLTMLAEQEESQAYGKDRGGYLGMYLMNMPEPGDNTGTDEKDDGAEQVNNQLVVADAEHCLSLLAIGGHTKDDELLSTDRTIVGFNDEILDLRMIPSSSGATTQVVVATNSAQVRMFDLGTFSCHTLDGHTATVLCVDVSPCGRYIATCGKDNRMCLWHAESRQCIATAVGHTEAVGATALSRKKGRYDVGGKAAKNGGGAFAVTVSLDRTLKRWNLPGSKELDEAEEEAISLDATFSSRAHEKDINVVSIAPNDSFVATGSQDKCAKLWRSTDLSLVATLRGHRRGVWDVQFSPFDRVVATASGDRGIRLWSLGDYSCVRTFQGHVASVLRVRFLSGGLQLLSSGADGLIKLWTIRTNECEATMDGHSDKVWALDVPPVGKTMISGSADSKLLVWKDTTKITEDAKRAEREEAFLMDQRLANHLRHKEFGQALDIALTLDKPRLTLRVLTSIIETELKEKRNPVKCLQQYVPTWSTERVVQVLQYCRDWNTRARNCDVAMTVIRAIVSVLPADEMGADDSVGSILAGVTPYAERHFDRLDGLLASSYLLDFALFSMGSLDVEEENDEFAKWEASSKLVLPPAYVDGKIQLGGKSIVGARATKKDKDEDVSVVGDSDSSDEESDDDYDDNADVAMVDAIDSGSGSGSDSSSSSGSNKSGSDSDDDSDSSD